MRSKALTLYPVGSVVLLGEGEDTFTGMITGILIEGNCHVKYKVNWWNYKERVEDWFDSQDIDLSAPVTMAIRIGFAGNGTSR